MMAAMVALGGDCNMGMTRDCFERVSGLLALGSAVCGAAFAAATGAGPDIAGRFLADLDIEILRSVRGGPRTTEAPPRRSRRRGRISERRWRPETAHSSAPIRAGFQPFLHKLPLAVRRRLFSASKR